MARKTPCWHLQLFLNIQRGLITPENHRKCSVLFKDCLALLCTVFLSAWLIDFKKCNSESQTQWFFLFFDDLISLITEIRAHRSKAEENRGLGLIPFLKRNS